MRCDCGAAVEARIVLRGDEVVALKLCLSCGPTEETLRQGARQYVDELVARGQQEGLFKHTTSTCPSCLDLVSARVMIRSGRVYFEKSCPRCGESNALVSEDANHYSGAYAYARAGTEPLERAMSVRRGCPADCGSCADHEQHTCLPIVEVTDHCNLDCPICIVDNHHAHHLGVSEFREIVDRLIRAEGTLESIALSGGEPTSHPRILELLDAADRPEIARVVLITNGLRLGRNRPFAEAIKARGVYVSLQLDGFTASAHEVIRGRDLTSEKRAALEALETLQIPTQLIYVAARGVNEDQIGKVVDLFLEKPHILSLNFQPAAHTGQGGGRFPHDALDRLTIPGVIRRIEEQTGGRIKSTDFAPLPCSHPLCVSLTYLLRLDDGTLIPLPRFMDLKRHAALLRSSATLGASSEMEVALEDLVYDVFARESEIPRGPDILKALRRTLDVMFPGRPLSHKEQVRIGEQQSKSIFLHHYMDRHDFDLERLRKCCHHYARVDGRVMPACGFNMFHRGAAKGGDTPVAQLEARRARLGVVP